MATIMANMMTYMNTMKIMELSKIKNLIFHCLSSVALSKIKIVYEDMTPYYENYDNYDQIKKRIIQKDYWIGDNYKSFIFDEARLKVGRSEQNLETLNSYYSDIYSIKIANLSMEYNEMRYFCHRINTDLLILRLENCNITDCKLNCLIGINLDNLNHLSLANNPITDNGIKVLSKCGINEVETMILNGTRITPKTIDILLEMKVFNNVAYLEMVFGDEWGFVINTEKVRRMRLNQFVCREIHIVNYDYEKDEYLEFFNRAELSKTLPGQNLQKYYISILI